MKRFIALVVVVIAMLVAVGCGSSTNSNATGVCANAHHHHKIKVIAKVAATYVSFKHFVYTPYKAGAFKKGAPHRKAAFVKAGATLVADAVLLRSVSGDVKDDKQLCHIYSPFTRAADGMRLLGTKLKSGNGTEKDINGATNLFDKVRSEVKH